MRLKEYEEKDLNEAQLKVYKAIASGPRGGVRGPFNVLLRCPELADRVQHLGEYCRYGSSLSPRISEFAIIITGRYWFSQIEWAAHLKLALEGGLSKDVSDQLALGKRPTGMQPDEAAAFDFCNELHHNHEVSDATYAEAVKQFGENGVVDLMAVSGYYTLVAMILRVSQKALPGGGPDPLKPIPPGPFR
jgi:4-carboxymuconolactone decarboxylase